MRTNESIDIAGHIQHQLAVSAVAAQTNVLPEGIYDVWCTVDVYIKVAKIATGVTTSNGYKIAAGNTVAVTIPADHKLGAIAGGAGTLSYHRIG
jgi:hypothetical protein